MTIKQYSTIKTTDVQKIKIKMKTIIIEKEGQMCCQKTQAVHVREKEKLLCAKCT